MSEPIYQLRGLAKTYGDHCVVDVPELDIQKGEIFCVVGPSGAGKSTLLRLLNFLEPPTRGTIRFHGRDYGPLDQVPLEHRRKVTTVFQRSMLLNRTVWANVNYGLWLRGDRSSGALVDEALDQVGLKHVARQHARTLSGGELQRVALARAMVIKPDVLLLDEPTANLDPYNVGLIEDIVRKLNLDHGTTVVLVTHNVFQAKRLAHRVALLLECEIVEVAEVHKFFESSDNPRTGAFVRGEIVY
jgi:tungstate transport system ATP-binding protein